MILAYRKWMRFFLLGIFFISSLFAEGGLEKVSVQLDWKYQFEYAGYIAAQEKGYYREAGLDVELREYRNGIDVVSEILSKKATYGVYNSTISVHNGRLKPIVLMATYLQHSPLVFVVRKGIKKPADLIGKKVMLTDNERRNSSIALLLSHFGITDNNTQIIDQTFRVSDFIEGRVDAMSAYRSNQLYELDRAGVEYTIIDPVEYGFVASAGNLITSQKEAVEYSDRTQKMIEATNRGWDYAIKHPQEMTKILTQRYGVHKSPDALKYEAQVIQNLMMLDLYRIGEADSELTSRLFKQLQRAGIILSDQKLEEFLFKNIVAKLSKTLDLTSAEKQYLLQKKKILMCVDPEWYPFEVIRNGKHIGIAADVMKRFEKELGVPIELVTTDTWDETLQRAQERECDILSLASSTPSRLEYMDFTSPYVTLPIVMATQMDKPFTDNLLELRGKKIASVRGYSITEQLKASYPELTIIEVDSITDGLSRVESGEFYGYIDNLMVISSYVQKHYTGQLKVSMRLEENKVELAVGTRNDEPLLNSIFEKLVQNLDESTMQTIYNRWVTTVEEVAWIDEEMILKIGGVATLVFIAFMWRHYIISRYNRKLLKLSITDKLTGLYNRQKTDKRLIEEEGKVNRYRDYHCSVIMIDVDYFKRINDTMGHQTGDKVLIELAELMLSLFRQSDIVGRWGGEEFLVILPHTTIDEAEAAAEHFRIKVEEYDFGVMLNVTVSIGVGALETGVSVHESIAKVDTALYMAKHEGRNRVCTMKAQN
jgi:polar amino acid transport system substrate-binding protein